MKRIFCWAQKAKKTPDKPAFRTDILNGLIRVKIRIHKLLE